MDVNGNTTKNLNQVKTFASRMKSINCYAEIFVVGSAHRGSFIEEYNLSNWKLVRKYEHPFSCQMSQEIWQVRLSSNGSHLGVILRNINSGSHTFELRDRNDMKVIQVTEISHNLGNNLLSLPNQRFLINTLIDKNLFSIDANGQVKEIFTYNDEALIISTALINEKCLVIQTMMPQELRFYDL